MQIASHAFWPVLMVTSLLLSASAVCHCYVVFSYLFKLAFQTSMLFFLSFVFSAFVTLKVLSSVYSLAFLTCSFGIQCLNLEYQRGPATWISLLASATYIGSSVEDES